MNMQIRTFDVERSKTHEFDELPRRCIHFPKVFFRSLESLSQRINGANIVRFGALLHVEKRCVLRRLEVEIVSGLRAVPTN